MTENAANPWQQYWGESYGPESKQQLLKPVFDKLETEEKIGNLIIDVGSGASPVTQLLRAKPARKRICIDIAADNVGSLNDLRIRLDAEKVGQFGSLNFRKALLRVCAFLGVNPKTETKTERADTIVFSDMLNYVDFRRVLNGFGKYLKPGGRIIVFNLPNRGNGLLFSDKGLKDNRQLYAFLEEHRFEIEHKAFPKEPRNEKEESQELIVLVARKCVETLKGDAPGGVGDLVRVQIPVPSNWVESCEAPRLRISLAWDSPVNAAIEGVWASRKVLVRLRFAPDGKALSGSHGATGSYPLSIREFDLKKWPKGEVPSGDVWLVELSYEQTAEEYIGLTFSPQQRAAFAAELFDAVDIPVVPYAALEQVSICKTMTRLGIRPAIRNPVAIKVRA